MNWDKVFYVREKLKENPFELRIYRHIFEVLFLIGFALSFWSVLPPMFLTGLWFGMPTMLMSLYFIIDIRYWEKKGGD